MAFDYKKEYKEFYLPPKKPVVIRIPEMNFVAVRGKGNPNEEGGAYKEAIGILYAIAFTIKMSYKGNHDIAGYFQYVVPPLEGLWWQDGIKGVDYTKKEELNWISMIRLPEFVTGDVFSWAKAEAEEKKQRDFSGAEFFTYDEGLCVQCMHVGPYDDEPRTIAAMEELTAAMGYETDLSDRRLHHEIYLSDPRRCAEKNLRTVIRQPIKSV